VNQIEERRRKRQDIERCKRLGLAVQQAVKDALESHGLKLTLIDRGFDYEVGEGMDNVLEDVSTRLDVGPYLLEIKATTKGQARLTPTQAETASAEAERYVLCVVDLRGVSEKELDGVWTVDRIKALTKINSNIGNTVKETFDLVEIARTNAIAIRNDAALRYEVPVSVWEAGTSILEWVDKIRQPRRPATV
jgi:hypothetical protein